MGDYVELTDYTDRSCLNYAMDVVHERSLPHIGDGVNVCELASDHALQVADGLYPGVREQMVFVGKKATYHASELIRSLASCQEDDCVHLPWSARQHLRALASVEADSGLDPQRGGCEMTPQQVLYAVPVE